MHLRGLERLTGLALPFVLAGCVAANGATTQGPSQGVKLIISNGTTIAVTRVVNGSVVETVPPGSYEDPIKGSLPAMPWNVEVRSPSGRVMTTLDVHEGDYSTTSLPNDGMQEKGVARRLDLSCGRLDLWYGPPVLGPMYLGSFAPGDCA